MTEARHYWLSTIHPEGRPHTRPVDGLWLDDTLFFGGSEDSRWRRNLAANPAVCVNLEDGEQAVILHGEVETHTPGAEESDRLAAASNDKYGYGQSRRDYEGKELLLLRPRVVLAWTLLHRDATRFERVGDRRRGPAAGSADGRDPRPARRSPPAGEGATGSAPALPCRPRPSGLH